MSGIGSFIRELIDVPSVTGDEGALGDLVAGRLAGAGFAVERQPVSPGRANVWAVAGGAPRVVLCTHLDTVPPHIESREDDGFVYGRGACDAKGILAAMICAAEALRGRGTRDVGLLFVVGEEADSDGARAANRSAPAGVEYLIVGEPTDNRLATGHKGSFHVRLAAEGVAAHSAYPERGDSAIHRLLDALHEIRAADWGRDAALGPATVNVGTVEGGEAGNVVAAAAAANVFVRVVDSIQRARERLDAITAGNERLSYDVLCANEPVRCHVVDGLETVPVNFGSDIPSLPAFGTPLLIGPGSIHDAHTSGERIAIEDAEAAVRIYIDLVTRLLERSAS